MLLFKPHPSLTATFASDDFASFAPSSPPPTSNNNRTQHSKTDMVFNGGEQASVFSLKKRMGKVNATLRFLLQIRHHHQRFAYVATAPLFWSRDRNFSFRMYCTEAWCTEKEIYSIIMCGSDTEKWSVQMLRKCTSMYSTHKKHVQQPGLVRQ